MYFLGRVLNRFSKDIGFMDDILPYHFLEMFAVSTYYNLIEHCDSHVSIQILTRSVAIMLVACVANYWLFIPATVIAMVQFTFRWFFLHTSRNIKRLEALGKAYLLNSS